MSSLTLSVTATEQKNRAKLRRTAAEGPNARRFAGAFARVGEEVLFRLACFLYRRKLLTHGDGRESLGSPEEYNAWRESRIEVIRAAARKFDVPVAGYRLLDFGCDDGALTVKYPGLGARSVVGVDIDSKRLARARSVHRHKQVTFVQGSPEGIPLPDASVDTIISYDVFEHVTDVAAILHELFRVLRPGGKVLIGTWGWHHPYAPHLFATMPVPYAHLLFGEKTVLRVCRRIYQAPWYSPTLFDMEEDSGDKDPNKYLEESISTTYVNKLLIRDFEKLFRASSFAFRLYPIPFSSMAARLCTAMFLRLPGIREYVTGYLWVVLTKNN